MPIMSDARVHMRAVFCQCSSAARVRVLIPEHCDDGPSRPQVGHSVGMVAPGPPGLSNRRCGRCPWHCSQAGRLQPKATRRITVTALWPAGIHSESLRIGSLPGPAFDGSTGGPRASRLNSIFSFPCLIQSVIEVSTKLITSSTLCSSADATAAGNIALLGRR